MAIIQTLIVDDEAVAREGLHKLLQQEPDIELVGTCANGREAVEAIQTLQPDLVFMDVQMPEMNGFEALMAVDMEALPVIVFVTAYDQYALRAFDVHAVDYLLKPFTNQRLREALQQARRYLASETIVDLNQQVANLLDHLHARSEQSTSAYVERIPVKNKRRVRFVDVADIDWIEAADNYVNLHVGDQSHLVRSTLSEMEERLDPEQFLRIHRSHIVNVERIREVHPRGSGDCLIVLDDGTGLLSSRTYSGRRKELLRLSP